MTERVGIRQCAMRGLAGGVAAILTILIGGLATVEAASLPRLGVSDNRRFLVKADGSPFFWLGDTAWELFHRLNREEAARYLRNRAERRFTVIQAVALAELDGLNASNAYGDKPLRNNDPTQPDTTPGSDPKDAAQYDYWDHVDFVVDEAARRGLYIALLPTWGRWVHENNIFTPASARTYGEFLGRRYGKKPVIWVLGGDRYPDKPEQQAIWRAMAEGVVAGIGGKQDDALMTFHPSGGASSSRWFHSDAWLDFNMQQNGHGSNVDVWNRIERDYNRTPTKPVMDGEPLYEDHPIGFNAKENGTSNDYEIRKTAYEDVFAGAHGHTYGHHSVWQMHAPKWGAGVNGPLSFWYDALDRPGAAQMQHLRRLIESRPMLMRVPDQSVLASDPGDGTNRVQATRASDGSYLFVYTAAGQPVTIRMDKTSGPAAKAYWYDPRRGTSSLIGTFPNIGTRPFTPPARGAGNDWVLVLDSAARNFAPPGARVLEGRR